MRSLFFLALVGVALGELRTMNCDLDFETPAGLDEERARRCRADYVDYRRLFGHICGNAECTGKADWMFFGSGPSSSIQYSFDTTRCKCDEQRAKAGGLPFQYDCDLSAVSSHEAVVGRCTYDEAKEEM